MMIEEVWEKSVPWSEKTFPQSTPESIARHIWSEAKELVANPTDAMEVADLLLLIGHLQYKLGIIAADFAAHKFEQNKKRRWGSVNAEGFVEHVREATEGDKPPVHFMRLDPRGNPTGIGSTGGGQTDGEKEAPEQEAEKRPTIEVDAIWYEPCVSVKEGEVVGRGTVLFYKIGGRTFAKEPVWDDPQTSEMRPVQQPNRVSTRS